MDRVSVSRRARMYVKRFRAPSQIKGYLANTENPKLNLGCGGNILSGWLNVDSTPQPGAVYMDGSKAWPFPDAAFDAVLAEHMIEHMPRAAAQRLLGEAMRVLKPGGVLRVVTPDLAFFGRLALDAAGPAADQYLKAIGGFLRRPLNACEAVNEIFYNYGHRFIYSVDEMRRMLLAAGYSDLVETRASEPVDLTFEGVEGHGFVIGHNINALEAFAFEARKPAMAGVRQVIEAPETRTVTPASALQPAMSEIVREPAESPLGV